MSKSRSDDSRSAQRFLLNVPLQMEIPGANEPAIFATRDVSYKGVFFYSDHPLPENAPIRFTMKLKSAEQEDLQVVCTGTVVRVEWVGDSNGVAATIDSYKFMRQATANA